ncbi:MAG: RNA polymerase sigma factor [Myxococcales bacterium]|nr:RNA polymerase sigma factor [Myxococcales bacterium]
MGAASQIDEAGAVDDPILAALYRGDTRGALGLCARLHGAALGRLSMAFLGSQAEAEEAVQETLLAAYDGFGGYRAEASLRAWLFGIARRVCARKVETRARREQRLRLVHNEADSAVGADVLLAQRRRAERVRLLLEQLKPSERDAVVLRFDGELSFREVADACGVDEATARKRVSRALERLRHALKDEE